MHLHINTILSFFEHAMPKTKELIDQLCASNPTELIKVFNEFTKTIGYSGYEYTSSSVFQKPNRKTTHEYTDPWRVM